MKSIHRAAVIWVAAGFVACSAPPPQQIEPPATEPEVTFEPLSPQGNRSPYRVDGRTYFVLPRAEGYVETGLASWYGKKFHGKPTSNRETYDMHAFSAAHRTLPLPSLVTVTNLENGREVTVRVNDRGPFKDGRIIDLSYAAAAKLGMVEAGTAMVEVRALTPPGIEQRPDVDHADHLFLQLGAFAERDNALTLLKRLRAGDIEQGFVYTGEDATGRTVHRVRIGPLADEAAAAALAERIARLGFEGSRVVFE